MKFGLNLINFGPGASAESIGASAAWAEQLGFQLVMVSDHVAITADVAFRSRSAAVSATST